MAKLAEDVFVVEPVRPPIGKFGGTLSTLTAVEIATVAASETLKRSGIDDFKMFPDLDGLSRALKKSLGFE